MEVFFVLLLHQVVVVVECEKIIYSMKEIQDKTVNTCSPQAPQLQLPVEGEPCLRVGICYYRIVFGLVTLLA